MILEKACIDDIEELVRMRIDYLTEDYGNISESSAARIKEKLPDYLRRHIDRDLFIYAAKDNDKIVSCCFLLVTEKPSNPTFINGMVGSVLNVYTMSDYRKRGLAVRLMQMLLDDALKMNLDFVELKATDAGFSLYEKVGFKQVESKYRNMKIVLNYENME